MRVRCGGLPLPLEQSWYVALEPPRISLCLPASWTGRGNQSHPSIEQRKMAPPRQDTNKFAN